jgi:hypothetical protein
MHKLVAGRTNRQRNGWPVSRAPLRIARSCVVPPAVLRALGQRARVRRPRRFVPHAVISPTALAIVRQRRFIKGHGLR